MSTKTTKGRPYRKALEKYPNALRKMRLHLGLTLRDLGDKTGISFQHISIAERTGKELSTGKWCILADFFGMSVQELLNPNLDPNSFFASKLNGKLD